MFNSIENIATLEINSLIVESDRVIHHKYWIWFTFYSNLKTIVRIEAIIRHDIFKWLELLELGKEKTGKRNFMGYHSIFQGENKLPPLPLVLEDENKKDGALVLFKVKPKNNENHVISYNQIISRAVAHNSVCC